ncbi:MAG: 2-oxoacid:ferredoxin oxidoreductase subunit beta [Candidatus Magasanikbacteria bacterium]|nr:2-oxoacid:ferredoxin oxidoreductase subunit beta [Candidatus Magasanikbacteria bacterium]
MTTSVQNLKTPNMCNWCPGCGNFGIWTSFKEAAMREKWDNTNSVIVAGIGCHGHINNFIELSSFEGLHGRALPVASGIKMVNDRLNVFVFTGDGDCLAEGGNHFMHAARRNQDLNVILHDNAVYGLTTGQTSPRSPHGYKSKSTPTGNLDEPINPLLLALTAGATFIARAYSGDVPRLTSLMIEASKHKGFSVLQVLQPCVTFNRIYTHAFFQENIYHLDKKYNPQDKQAAFAKIMEWGIKQIPVGVLYQEDRPSYEQQIPQIQKGPLLSTPIKKKDISETVKLYQ